MELLAKAILLAAKYREESYTKGVDITDSLGNVYPTYSYSTTLLEASNKAAEEVGLDERGTMPVYLMLTTSWNDAIDWAESCVNPKVEIPTEDTEWDEFYAIAELLEDTGE